MYLKKKILTMVITAVAVLSLSVTAMAADNGDNDITQRARFQCLVAQRQLAAQNHCLSLEEFKALHDQKVEDGKLTKELAATIIERVEARKAACNSERDTKSVGQCNGERDTKSVGQGNGECGTKSADQGNGECDTKGAGQGNGECDTKSVGQGNGECDPQCVGQGNGECDTQCVGQCDPQCDGKCDTQCVGQCDVQSDGECGCPQDGNGNRILFGGFSKGNSDCPDNVQDFLKARGLACPQAK